MRTVSIRELRENLADYLRSAEEGERVLITRRGSAVAELIGVSPVEPSPEIARALREGAVARPGDVVGLRRMLEQPPSGPPANLVDELLADRDRR